MILGTILLVITVPQIVVNGYDVTEKEYASMPTLFPTDDFDKCMLFGDTALYCYIRFQLAPLNKTEPSKIWKSIEATSSSPTHYKHDLIRYFLCVTDSCPGIITTKTVLSNPDEDVRLKQQIDHCLDTKYAHMGLQGNIESLQCRTSKPKYVVETMDYVALTIFIAYITFVVTISLYDLKKSYDSPEEFKSWRESRNGIIANAFSIRTNWAKLKSENKSPDGEKMKSVQGLRVYMTFLVVLVHTITGFAAAPVSNPQFLEELNDSKPLVTEFPKRGIFLLSFHFMMSTWVLMSSVLAKSDKKEPININFIVKSVIKRYVRFLPSVLLIVGFYVTWYRHIPFGPFWTGICEESERCRKNWWTNLLFVQNYVDRYFMCYIISWYLGVEMQYYIISLVLIMILHKNRDKIPLVIGLLLPVNVALAFWDHYRHSYSSKLSSDPEKLYNLQFNKEPQWHDHFASYHANFAGSLVGLALGYFYYKYKNVNVFKTTFSIVMWWILSLGMILVTVCGPQFYDVDATPAHSALWVAITRPLFAIGMGLLVFGMTQGLGGVVKWFFEWNPLYVLAKLSYCVYIGHAVFQNIRVGLLRQPAHLDYYSFVNIVLSDIAIAFIAAVFLTMFFEMPANDLANMLFRSRKVPQEEKKSK